MKDRKLDGVRRDAETLAKLVGLTVAFNSEEWDATRQVYRKQFEKFIGKVDEYGSISEYLSDRGFSLFNLCFQD